MTPAQLERRGQELEARAYGCGGGAREALHRFGDLETTRAVCAAAAVTLWGQDVMAPGAPRWRDRTNDRRG